MSVFYIDDFSNDFFYCPFSRKQIIWVKAQQNQRVPGSSECGMALTTSILWYWSSSCPFYMAEMNFEHFLTEVCASALQETPKGKVNLWPNWTKRMISNNQNVRHLYLCITKS